MEHGKALLEAYKQATATLTAAVDRVVDEVDEPFVAVVVLDEIRQRLTEAVEGYEAALKSASKRPSRRAP